MSDLLAFTAEHVSRLTGLSLRQIGYWDKTEFFSPTLVEGARSRAFGRIYGFRDVVGLRTIAILRKDKGISLQELRRVGAWLHRHHNEPWSTLRFAMSGRRVVFIDPESGVAIEPRGEGQEVFSVVLELIATEMSQAAKRLQERQPAQIGNIVRNRYVLHNAWAIEGTRVSTGAIWNFHQAGYDSAAIVREYPRLTAQDVEAAVQFEAQQRQAA